MNPHEVSTHLTGAKVHLGTIASVSLISTPKHMNLQCFKHLDLAFALQQSEWR